MMSGLDIATATLHARLPETLHYQGEPTEWVRVTRPGLSLHSFLEGPCFDDDGALWLVDVPYGRLFRIGPEGDWDVAHRYDGEPHGLASLGSGRFAIADYAKGLLRFDAGTGAIETICSKTNTEAFRGVADITRAPNGDLWFTDPGRTSLSDPTGRLFRLAAGASAPQLVLANIPYPNGVALSPDGAFVYVAATRANAVWRLLADAPDPVWPMTGTYIQLSGGLGPDGLACHPSGLLAVAHAQAGRAFLFNDIGDPLAVIKTPEGRWTTAVRFTPDGSALCIVEAETGSVYKFDVNPYLQNTEVL